ELRTDGGKVAASVNCKVILKSNFSHFLIVARSLPLRKRNCRVRTGRAASSYIYAVAKRDRKLTDTGLHDGYRGILADNVVSLKVEP
ncbi:MAG: hypothetical protein ACFNXE_04810, partial [Rothia dentocariosa]